MKYENAKELLPETLLREVQKYASGKLLYIPSVSGRKAWGEQSGARADFQARNHEIRTRFFKGIPPETLAEDYFLAPETIRKIAYRKENPMSKKSLPDVMFPYEIEECPGPIPEVVCEEHPGYAVVPRVGEKAVFARYRSQSHACVDIIRAEAVSEAEIHGESGVRINVYYHPDDKNETVFDVAQLTENGIRNLAWGEKTENGGERLHTFLEGQDFIERWGDWSPTHLTHRGDIEKQGNRVAFSDPSVVEDAVGRYRVTMNGRQYDTVLVVNVEDIDRIVTEDYISLDGHGVLFRSFRKGTTIIPRCGDAPLSEVLPDAERLFVNGEEFVHFNDCISDYVC